MMKLRKEINKILESTILSEDISNEEMKEKLLPLSKHILENIPSKLFRNRPCSEMNIDAFNEDKLYAVTPDKFSQWSYEKEWRLIVSKINEFQDKSPVCIYNIRPTAIYYGSDIAPINRKMLHMIAKEKGIKEYQMYIDNRSYNYSMRFKRYNP